MVADRFVEQCTRRHLQARQLGRHLQKRSGPGASSVGVGQPVAKRTRNSDWLAKCSLGGTLRTGPGRQHGGAHLTLRPKPHSA